MKENFFVPVWDTIADLRHDRISVGSVFTDTFRAKKYTRNFSARTEMFQTVRRFVLLVEKTIPEKMH